MRRVWLLLLPCLVLSACGSSSSSSKRTHPVAATSKAELRTAKAARELVEQVYDDLRRGDTDSIATLLTLDAVITNPAGTTYAGRSPAVVALSRALPRRKHRIRSKDLDVISSPGAKAAWAVDTVDINGDPYRVAAIMVDDGGLWSAVAVHIMGPYVVPAPGRGPDAIDPAAEEVAKLFRAATVKPVDLYGQLADRPEVIILGPGKRDVARGRKAIKKMWKKKLAQSRITLRDGVRAGVTPDGTLAWVSAPIDVAGDGKPLDPQRCFAIYQRQGGTWELVALVGQVLAPKN